MKALLTGATGYLGGGLATALVADGHEVVAVVRTSSDTTWLASLLGEARVLRYTDEPGSIESLVGSAGADAAFHLAACQDQGRGPESVRALVETNVLFGARFAEACATSGVAAFVSAGTYSTHATGGPEYHPASVYAATKRAFEDILAFYAGASSMRCITLELTDTYGPHDPRGKFLRLVAEASAAGQPLGATAGEQYVSLVHADDVADAFVHAAQGLLAGDIAPGTYSVIADEILSLRAVVDVWREVTGREVDVRWGERPYPAGQIMRPFTERRLPGWSPSVTLSNGLAQVYGSSAS